MPRCPCAPLAMCPIIHVPHPQGTPSLSLILTMIPLCPCVPLPMCPVVHVPHHPCAPSPMCPITYVPHLPRCPISIFSINHDTHLPMCPIAHMSSCQKDVKLSKRCQVAKKMSNVKKSNTWTMEEVHKKNKLT